MKLVAWLSTCSLALLGCALPPPTNIDHDADPRDASIDAMSDASIDAGPDANTACVPDSVVCEADHYVQCSAAGVVEVEMDCPLGCDASSSRCRDIDPSNGVELLLEQTADPASPDLVLQNGATINTDTGVVFDGTSSVIVPNAEHEVGAGITHRVFMVRSLVVTGTTKVTGSRGLIIVSNGDVEVSGTLDISADGQTSGPGRGEGSCAGGGTESAAITGGGGGGGNGTPGAYGGAGNGGTVAAGLPGQAQASDTLEPLVGGCDGGTVVRTGGDCTHFGGGGGGAIQVTSRTEIRLVTTGTINAGGGGGRSGTVGVDGCTSTSNLGGGGGGAGGSVLLEAPQVVFSGAGVVIGASGGGGAAAGVGSARAGADGGTAEAPAAGGVNLTTGDEGGDGGTVVLAAQVGETGGSNGHGSGGGGAVGRARINTVSGNYVLDGGASLRLVVSSGVLGLRLVP